MSIGRQFGDERGNGTWFERMAGRGFGPRLEEPGAKGWARDVGSCVGVLSWDAFVSPDRFLATEFVICCDACAYVIRLVTATREATELTSSAVSRSRSRSPRSLRRGGRVARITEARSLSERWHRNQRTMLATSIVLPKRGRRAAGAPDSTYFSKVAEGCVSLFLATRS
jgi:hypothetical protein